MCVEYVLPAGTGYKGHEEVLRSNVAGSEWGKPTPYEDVDLITGIADGKYGKRKWVRGDGKASAAPLDFE
jgi:hypothetical protein